MPLTKIVLLWCLRKVEEVLLFFSFFSFLLSLRAFKLVSMYRVYLGNLDEQVTEPVLEKVFADHNLPVTSILIKRGYGFVDCPDQTTFDQTIDRLNGVCL